MDDQCTVCGSPAEIIGDGDYGERRKQRCTRCGLFEVSGTALAMLPSRMAQDKDAVARLSHAIRIRTTEENPLFVSSANLDELIKQRLPNPDQQLKLLAQWLASQLGDDSFGRTPMPWPLSLAGITGSFGSDQVERLIKYAVEQKIVETSVDESLLGLSPKGWALIGQETPALPKKQAHGQKKIVRALCNMCGGERDSFQHNLIDIPGSEAGVDWSDTYEVLECCGCHSSRVRHTFWLSEWDTITSDPITGQQRLSRGEEVRYWPPQLKRKKPKWIAALDDPVLRAVIDEVYAALDLDLFVLASMGTRTLLDRAMFLRVGDKGGFYKKLQLMRESGHISADELNTLATITDAGSAAAHRGFAPNPETFEIILEITENFLQREFVLKSAAGDVRKATPPRKPEG